MNKKLTAPAIAAATLAATTAHATLVARLGGQALYDDVANLTWLQDANYAKTSGYDADGLMTWDAANTWAGSLNIDGVTEWRLPRGAMAVGYDQTVSEIGNLFFDVLGGNAQQRISSVHNSNYYLFRNIQETGRYWTGVELDIYSAFRFDFIRGFSNFADKSGDNFAWPVHDGDVGPTPVPLPAAAFLLAPALGGLGFMRRRTS